MSKLLRTHGAALGLWAVICVLLVFLSGWVYGRLSHDLVNYLRESRQARLADRLELVEQQLDWAVTTALEEQRVMQVPEVDAVLLVDADSLRFDAADRTGEPQRQLKVALQQFLALSRQAAPGLAYWRDRTYLVKVASAGERSAVAARDITAWTDAATAPLAFAVTFVAAQTNDEIVAVTGSRIPLLHGGYMIISPVATADEVTGEHIWPRAIIYSMGVAACLVWFFYVRRWWRPASQLARDLSVALKSEGYTRRVGTMEAGPLAALSVQINAALSLLEYCYNLMVKTNRVTSELLFKAEQINGGGREILLDETDELNESMSTVARLSAACEQDEFEICVQPQRRLNDDAEVVDQEYEVLSFWRNEGDELISVVELASVCERAGLLQQLTLSMVRNGLAASRALCRDVAPEPRITLHLADSQVNRALLMEVFDELTEAERSCLRCLVFEVNERLIKQAFDRVEVVVAYLRGVGSGVSISDFGMSQYALMFLQRLPITHIKLATTLWQSHDISVRERQFLEALVRLAGDIDVKVVVTQIDAPEQLMQLQGIAGLVGQGGALAPVIPLSTALAG